MGVFVLQADRARQAGDSTVIPPWSVLDGNGDGDSWLAQLSLPNEYSTANGTSTGGSDPPGPSSVESVVYRDPTDDFVVDSCASTAAGCWWHTEGISAEEEDNFWANVRGLSEEISCTRPPVEVGDGPADGKVRSATTFDGLTNNATVGGAALCECPWEEGTVVEEWLSAAMMQYDEQQGPLV